MYKRCIAECFIHKNIPYIRVNRKCSKYEEHKNKFQNKSRNNEELLNNLNFKNLRKILLKTLVSAHKRL